MNKKGSAWEEISTTNLLALILTLIALTSFSVIGYNTYHYFTKDSSLPPQIVNRLRIVATLVEGLPVGSGPVTVPLIVGEQKKGLFENPKHYLINIYPRCQAGEKPSEKCALRPKMCIKDREEGITPFCEDIKNADFASSDSMNANSILNVDKEEVDGIVKIKLYV